MGGVPHLQRADRAFLAGTVEHDHAPRSSTGDEARERVDEHVAILERARVQEVVAVEEIEGRLSHRESSAGAALRRAGRLPRPRR